jgi:hypothetical protein
MTVDFYPESPEPLSAKVLLILLIVAVALAGFFGMHPL